MIDTSTVWNDLIKLRDKTTDMIIKNQCSLFLNQINTADGAKVKLEAANWLNTFKK